MKFDFISILIFTGFIQGIFIGTIHLIKGGTNRKANKYLGWLLIISSITILHFLFFRAGIYKAYPHAHKIFYPLLFLIGPFFYLYVKQLIKPKENISLKSFLHFIPSLVVLILLVPYYIQSANNKLELINNYENNKFLPLDFILGTGQIIQLIIYLILSKISVTKYYKSLKEQHSSTVGINLFLINYVIWGMASIFVLIFISSMLQSVGLLLFSDFNIYTPIFFTVIIYVMGYILLGKSQTAEIDDNIVKYKGSKLTEKEAEKYLNCLTKYMREKKPYLKNDLTILDLAELTNIPPRYLSQIINTKLSLNFYEFVNKYRIEECIKLFKEESAENYTILALALESGFQSKTAFNTAFKKFTGKTPSALRKSINREGKITAYLK